MTIPSLNPKRDVLGSAVLVDTNIVSELMRPSPHAKVVAWARRETRFHMSVVTIVEVSFGLASKPNAAIEAWFARFVERHCDVLPATLDVAEWAGRTRGRLRARGKQRTQADMLIAGTAVVHGLVVATRNIRDFEGCGVRVLNPFG